MPQAEAIQNSFSSSLGPLLSLAGIFFLNFLSRIALSPLLPTIEKDLSVGHGEAGSFFLLISLGYFAMLLASSVVSSQLNHRKTILLSSVLVGCALLFVSMSQDLWGIRLGFVLLGMAAGLYLPSGIVTLTALVRSQDLGKAIAVHELAPNLAYVWHLFSLKRFLRWGSWRDHVNVSWFCLHVLRVCFWFLGEGRNLSRGDPKYKNSLELLIHPLLLAHGHHLYVRHWSRPGYLLHDPSLSGRGTRNGKVLSQCTGRTLTDPHSGDCVPLQDGSLTVSDRNGTLRVTFVGVGVLTSLLGLTSGSWLSLIVFLQPVVAAAFFPPGFTLLSKMSSVGTRNLVTSLTVAVRVSARGRRDSRWTRGDGRGEFLSTRVCHGWSLICKWCSADTPSQARQGVKLPAHPARAGQARRVIQPTCP